MARDVAETTIIQRNAKEELLARVYSARSTLIYAAFGISSLVMGWVTDKFGVRITYKLAATLFLVSFIVAIWNKKHLYAETSQQGN